MKNGIWALALLVGCMADDYGGDDYTGTSTSSTAATAGTGGGTASATDEDGLLGTWFSEGDDLSVLFSSDPFNYVEISASFEDDGTYIVVSTDATGTDYELTGTYSTDDSTSPATIVLNQVTPYEATAEGIWQAAGGVLTYEVVQTVPDYGFAPPTPDAGFGSTAGTGMTDGINVQVYRR